MSRRISETTLNASTIDILNVIRANATYEYQSLVPEVTVETDIPKVGDVLFGHPAMANQFLNALVNRIAFVAIRGATFNNPYAALKKGYLELGETVEEVYVQISKARIFSAEKAEAREFKRSIPDVRTAFHTINWRVQYPITIQNEDLRQAFVSFSGVEDLIARIIESVYTAAQYDEFLLFKYLLIKAISHGKMLPKAFDASKPANSAVAFRAMSNKLTFMSNKYNASGVDTITPKANQYIFMDAEYNAEFDVNVLASAFNMDKADFMGRLTLIDDWTTFDNERFDQIRAESDGLEEVTTAELALMKDVKGVLVDDEWFQVYDNLTTMSETYVASGLYWNYFFTNWKTVSSSPFANAVVFVDDAATLTAPASLTVEVVDKSANDKATVLTLIPKVGTASLAYSEYNFVQTEDATKNMFAVQKYGAIIIPAGATATKMQIALGDNTYTSSVTIAGTEAVGATITFAKDE